MVQTCTKVMTIVQSCCSAHKIFVRQNLIPGYPTVRYGKHSIRYLGPDYPQVIDSDPLWAILEGTSSKKNFTSFNLLCVS